MADETTSDADLAARSLALTALATVLRRKRGLDEAFAAGLADGRDRGFARLLVATVLRRLGQIDGLIDAVTARPAPLKPEVRDLLRLGVAQLLFLGTPAHAAVDTTVRLAGAASPTRPYKTLINALLRRLAREGEALAAGQDAARLCTPNWLWQAWRSAWGEETAHAIAAAHLREAPLDITLKAPAEASLWAERLSAEILPTGTLRRTAGGAVGELPGFAEGAWWVQDAAAALPVPLLGAVAGQRVFDLCAAPGGKTAQLAAAGARVTAVDRSEPRLARLAGNLNRLGLTAETVAADAASWRPDEPADAVLLDAPCSATGTIRRHPDLPHLKGPADLDRLIGLQRRLLAHAVTLLRPGGVLVYAVCSLQPEEGERRIAELLANCASVTRRPVTADEIGGLDAALTAEGDIRTLPCQFADRGGLDGFYIARLVRD